MFCVVMSVLIPRGEETGGGAEEVLSAWKSLACQLLPSAGTGTCIDLSNPGKMCKGYFASSRGITADRKSLRTTMQWH